MKTLGQIAGNIIFASNGIPMCEVILVLTEPDYSATEEEITKIIKTETVRFLADPQVLRDAAQVLIKQADSLEEAANELTAAIIQDYKAKLHEAENLISEEEENAGAEQSNAG